MREQLLRAFDSSPDQPKGPLRDIANGFRARFGYQSVTATEEDLIAVTLAGRTWELSMLMGFLRIWADTMFGGQIPFVLLDPADIRDVDQIGQFIIVSLANGDLDPQWMRWDGHNPPNVLRTEVNWIESDDPADNWND